MAGSPAFSRRWSQRLPQALWTARRRRRARRNRAAGVGGLHIAAHRLLAIGVGVLSAILLGGSALACGSGLPVNCGPVQFGPTGNPLELYIYVGPCNYDTDNFQVSIQSYLRGSGVDMPLSSTSDLDGDVGAFIGQSTATVPNPGTYELYIYVEAYPRLGGDCYAGSASWFTNVPAPTTTPKPTPRPTPKPTPKPTARPTPTAPSPATAPTPTPTASQGGRSPSATASSRATGSATPVMPAQESDSEPPESGLPLIPFAAGVLVLGLLLAAIGLYGSRDRGPTEP
jgi:hypothetical protein